MIEQKNREEFREIIHKEGPFYLTKDILEQTYSKNNPFPRLTIDYYLRTSDSSIKIGSSKLTWQPNRKLFWNTLYPFGNIFGEKIQHPESIVIKKQGLGCLTFGMTLDALNEYIKNVNEYKIGFKPNQTSKEAYQFLKNIGLNAGNQKYPILNKILDITIYENYEDIVNKVNSFSQKRGIDFRLNFKSEIKVNNFIEKIRENYSILKQTTLHTL